MSEKAREGEAFGQPAGSCPNGPVTQFEVSEGRRHLIAC
jgi:hypothetical protein